MEKVTVRTPFGDITAMPTTLDHLATMAFTAARADEKNFKYLSDLEYETSDNLRYACIAAGLYGK